MVFQLQTFRNFCLSPARFELVPERLTAQLTDLWLAAVAEFVPISFLDP